MLREMFICFVRLQSSSRLFQRPLCPVPLSSRHIFGKIVSGKWRFSYVVNPGVRISSICRLSVSLMRSVSFAGLSMLPFPSWLHAVFPVLAGWIGVGSLVRLLGWMLVPPRSRLSGYGAVAWSLFFRSSCVCLLSYCGPCFALWFHGFPKVSLYMSWDRR
jgi:hypothetical protein